MDERIAEIACIAEIEDYESIFHGFRERESENYEGW
jgi:hypothetical protein